MRMHMQISDTAYPMYPVTVYAYRPVCISVVLQAHSHIETNAHADLRYSVPNVQSLH